MLDNPPTTAPKPKRVFAVLGVGIVAFVLLMVAARWDPAAGFTRLIQFDNALAAQRIPELRELPLPTVHGGGYDGQFYAQIAVKPDVTSPDLQHALDDPQYRSRRILLPLVAHLAGGGHPFAVLQIYALLNVLCWLALAKIWWGEVSRLGERGRWIWAACLLSLGALDSVRLSLTDLPATLFLVLAVRAAERTRPALAVGWFVAAGFIRETSILAAPMLRFGREDTRSGKIAAWGARFLCILPILLWCGWLWWKVPGDTAAGNIDWPGFGITRHFAACVHEIASGNFDSRQVFGLIGGVGLACQSVFLLRRWRENDAWTRLGLPFALMFWLLSAYVFSGYWAAARACLPLTFAFNRLLPGNRHFWPWFIAGNLFALHGIWRMLP